MSAEQIKDLYHKVMMLAIGILITIIGFFGKVMIQEIQEMNDKLGEIMELVIKNQKDIEYLKEGK